MQPGDTHSPQAPGLTSEYLCIQGSATDQIEIITIVLNRLDFDIDLRR